jgi:sorbitol-specific phosphotransferase system component IIBC
MYVADMFSFLSFLSVLTKVVVYTGIGVLSHTIVPAMFEALEWGV